MNLTSIPSGRAPRPASRRSIVSRVVGLAAVVALAGATQASAQTWPSRPITLIVPYAAGGNVDAVARSVAPALAKRLGQQVLVENVAGAGGIIGTDRAARAAPDGNTLLLSVESTIVIAKLVSPSVVKYDGLRDFAPVTLLASSPLVLVGKPSLPAANMDELVKLLRANPGKYNYATSGIGTSLHVAGEMFNQTAKVQATHVPYKVGAQIVTDLMGEQIDLAMLPIPLTSAQVSAGKVKAYGVTQPTRSNALPDVPSMNEHPDTKGVDLTVWFGVFAPARTDAAIVGKLHQALTDVLKDEALNVRFTALGMRPLGMGPERFTDFLAAEHTKFSAIVKAAGIRAE
ncbi:MAG: Bug family tripartite tricarboxylate transporter substrate binding protein [Lautropia sp.]